MVNYKKHQTREWDKLPSNTARKLLSREDSRRYVRTLETTLEKEHGVDISALQSQLKYHAVDLVTAGSTTAHA